MAMPTMMNALYPSQAQGIPATLHNMTRMSPRPSDTTGECNPSVKFRQESLEKHTISMPSQHFGGQPLTDHDGATESNNTLNPARSKTSHDTLAPKDELEMEALDGLSALSLAGLPTISKHQEEIERATMTDEERVAALTDVFGEYCALDIRQNKRSKCDLGPEEIEFLLQQMSMELELIPASRKQALLYAQTVCNIDEFIVRSGSRNSFDAKV